MKLNLPVILTAGLLASMPWLGGCSLDGSPDTPVLSGLFDTLMPPTPGEAARDAFNLYDADKRRRSVNLLAASPFGMEEPYVRTYRLLVDDSDPSVRAACIKALGMHGIADDAATIAAQLSNESSFVRWEAAKALQRLHHKDAIDPLRHVLDDDEDADVRMAAAGALGQYPLPTVFDALIGALTDSNFGVALSARRSLTTLTGQDHGGDPGDWMDWAGQHRSTLFSDGQPYVYYPYDRPPDTFEKMQFWQERTPIEPRTPTGLQPTATRPAKASEG